MSIPVYLAIKGDETINYPKNLLAQVGFGFHASGSVRAPTHILPGAAAVLDDLYLPNFSTTALHFLKEKLPSCYFADFERAPNLNHQKLIKHLSAKKLLAVPLKFHNFYPSTPPMISCPEPCNSWLQFLINMKNSYPKGWFWEITPWNQLRDGKSNYAEGYLRYAVCRFRRENNKLRYYDTSETIAKKLAMAEANGCVGAITLYSEVKCLK